MAQGQSQQLTPGLVHTPFLIGLPNLIEDKWRQRLAGLSQAVDDTAAVSVTVPVAVTGAIGVTPLPLNSVRTGMYRITVYSRITVPASVNSSLTITIRWNDGAVACARALTANTGNTTDSTTNDTLPISVLGGTSITYEAAYVSNAAGMQADVTIVVEQLGQ
jgi:hypothetical protein